MKKIKIDFKAVTPRGTIADELLHTCEQLYLDEERMLVYAPVASAEIIYEYWGKIEEVKDEGEE